MAHFVHFISLIVELERAFKNALHSVSACSSSEIKIIIVMTNTSYSLPLMQQLQQQRTTTHGCIILTTLLEYYYYYYNQQRRRTYLHTRTYEYSYASSLTTKRYYETSSQSCLRLKMHFLHRSQKERKSEQKYA